MSTAKETTIKLPKQIGANNLVDSLGKINLSPEMKEFLASLGAKLVVTYSSGSEKPEVELLDRSSNIVCSIDEFIKLGGFRRWVNDELKALEKVKLSNEKVDLVAFFYRAADDKNIQLPERIEEANETKFRQFHSMIKIILENMKVIEGTINNEFRGYLILKAAQLVKVLYKLMLDCFRAERLPKEAYEEETFACGIPKWIYNKLVDKQFTANVKADASTLLFPKGNYLKAVSLTSKEISSNEFLETNKVILKKSGCTIALARSDLGFLFPAIPDLAKEDVAAFVSNYMWTLNSPFAVEDILAYRTSGKSTPTFKARQKPNPKPGEKTRPETETQRLCREIHNALGIVISTWLHIQNLVIPVANPLQDFWSKLVTSTGAWEITPTHGLYLHLMESKADLGPLHSMAKPAINELIFEIIIQSLRIPNASTTGRSLRTLLKEIWKAPEYSTPDGVNPIGMDDAVYCVNLADLKKTAIPKTVREATKKFLGIRPKEDDDEDASKKKNRRTGQSSVRLHSSVLNELEVLETFPEMQGRVREWIASTFKTGNYKKTQLLAARMVAGEVLMNQDKLFEENFDEYKILESIEEYEEDE